MTVRLVKREQVDRESEKQAQPPSATQLFLTTQGWVEEFKSRKATTKHSLLSLLRRD
ncbi:MAG: hypothetical protein AABO57_01485 [Acidobacteriota bacterium]